MARQMRSGICVFAVTISCSLVTQAPAQEWYTGARDKQQDATYGVAIDASLTGTSRGSAHASLIGTIAPFSKMDETGMRLRLGGLFGVLAP